LLHTLAEVFSGNRKRFKELWIDKSDYDFPFHPVISLSMSLSSPTTAKLEENLTNKIIRIADKFHVKIDYLNDKFKGSLATSYFGNLLNEVSNKFETEVVVLIDEYDAPVTRNMSNLAVAEGNAKFLHDFFASLKDILFLRLFTLPLSPV
jgi:hypothetical protein